MLRYLTAGESHGPALVVVVEGLPAGLPITIDVIGDELARRRLGYGRGPRMRFERDEVEFLGGVRHGYTLGSPLSIIIHNTEWPKWQEEMSSKFGLEFRARMRRHRFGDLQFLACDDVIENGLQLYASLSRGAGRHGRPGRAQPHWCH